MNFLFLITQMKILIVKIEVSDLNLIKLHPKQGPNQVPNIIPRMKTHFLIKVLKYLVTQK